MAQIRRPHHYRSPPPRHIPSLPHPIRIQPPTRIKIRTIPSQPSNVHPLQNPEQSLLSLNSNNIEESIILPALQIESNEFFERKHLPVYARFPFDLSRLTQPMEINLEDNIHKLRLRLIDSELDHQRRSTDEYLRRTHRIGMDNEPMNSSEVDRGLETYRTQEQINQRRRSNQQLITPHHSYDSRLHLQPLHEEQIFISSNIDDLIDSMARRHLAQRRLDDAIDRQRRGNYTESVNTSRTVGYNNATSRNHTERDYVLTNPTDFNRRLRSRIDYYNRIQPDLESIDHNDSTHPNSFRKLPPISSGRSSTHVNPVNSTDRSEHVVDLPSDIFLSGRSRTGNSSSPSHLLFKEMKYPSNIDEENTVPVSHRSKKHSNHEGFFTESNHHIQRKRSKFHRSKFRQVAIGILFYITLQRRTIRNRHHRSRRSPSATIHQIRLQEIIVALHRVYLEPDGPIFNILIQAISSPISLEAALDKSSKNYVEAIQIIGDTLTNLISKLTEFMPKDGVLGTGKSSALCALIQNGNSFPENYFWQCEREFLEFNGSKIINITKQRAILLLIGIFLFRSLVTTLLIKPIKYRLILGQFKDNQSINLKVLATVILYLGRTVAGRDQRRVLTSPHEWQVSFYSDENIRTIIEHSQMQSIIERCQHSLRTWCEEYIRRLDASVGNKFRH